MIYPSPGKTRDSLKREDTESKTTLVLCAKGRRKKGGRKGREGGVLKGHFKRWGGEGKHGAAVGITELGRLPSTKRKMTRK